MGNASTCTTKCVNTMVKHSGPTSQADCDDGNPCTRDLFVQINSCTARCDHPLVSAGTSCGDGRICMSSGSCEQRPSECGNQLVEPGEACDLGGVSLDGQRYDKWSCDSRCNRLYDFTPCTTSSDCGGSTCERSKCASSCSNNETHTCTTSSGVSGWCYAFCFPNCNGQSDCPAGTTCTAIGEPVTATRCTY